MSCPRPPPDDSPPTPAVEVETAPDPDDNKYRKETRRLPAWTPLVVVTFLVSIFLLVWLMDSRLPTALTLSDIPTHPETFIEERARRSLRALTSIGARPTGSYENEVLAVELLRRELHSIQQRAHPSHKLSIDIQVTSETKKSYGASSSTKLLEAERKFQPSVPRRADPQLQERPERDSQAGVWDWSKAFSPSQLSLRLCSSVSR